MISISTLSISAFALTQFPFPRLPHFPHPHAYPSPSRALRPRPPRDRCFSSATHRMPRVNRDWLENGLGPLRKFSRTFGGQHRATNCCPGTLFRDPHQPLREFHPFPSSTRSRLLSKSQLHDYHLCVPHMLIHPYANEDLVRTYQRWIKWIWNMEEIVKIQNTLKNIYLV